MNVEELKRQVEYRFAPEPLLAVQALANTYSFEGDEERLNGPEGTRSWLIGSALASAEVTVGAREHRDLIEFRGVIRALLEANLTGIHDAGAVERLSAALARRPVPLRAGADGVVELELAPVAGVDGLIAQMAGIAFQAQLLAQWERLKICASDECRWAFYDASRNRGGTWCQMEVCGNRMKNRSYRRRSASRPKQSGSG